MRLTYWLRFLRRRQDWLPDARPAASWRVSDAFGPPTSDGRSSPRRLRPLAPWRYRLPTRRCAGGDRGGTAQSLT